MRDEDRNTKFYHTSTVVWKNKGRIRMLKIEGEWVFDPIQIKTCIIDFFSSLFGESIHVPNEIILAPPGLKKVENREALRLTRRATPEEVRKVVGGMKKFGSPGLDGVPTTFYQKYWDVVCTPLTDMVN